MYANKPKHIWSVFSISFASLTYYAQQWLWSIDQGIGTACWFYQKKKEEQLVDNTKPFLFLHLLGVET